MASLRIRNVSTIHPTQPGRDDSVLFQTPRLQVRLLKTSDLNWFHLLCSDPTILRYTDDAPWTLDETARRLPEFVASGADMHAALRIWAVCEQGGAPVGTCSLERNDDGVLEIGYRLLIPCWGIGYGRELAHGLVAHCLAALGEPRLRAMVYADNTASVRILENAGFTLRKAFWNPKRSLVDREYELLA